MNRDEQDTFDSIIDFYNGGIEPLYNWATQDIAKAIRLLDAELQRRYDEDRVKPADDAKYDFDDTAYDDEAV